MKQTESNRSERQTSSKKQNRKELDGKSKKEHPVIISEKADEKYISNLYIFAPQFNVI